MIAIGLLATVLGILLVRLGWARRRGWAVAGWMLVVVAFIVLARGAGAWGVAAGGVAAMAAALALLGVVAWRTPAGRMRPGREPASVTLPRRPLGLARRVAVFALVVPVGLAASTLFAFGSQALAARLGAGAADTVALTLLLQPIAWTVLASVQMTRTGPLAMIAPAAACAAAGLLMAWPA